MKQILTILLLFVCLYTNAGEIIVRDGESIHDALRQAREWRRTNDARCQGGITITLQEGRYYMQEPLFLRPEDSGTKESPLVIRGIGEKHTSVICGDPRQKHRQIWPLKEQDDGLPKNRHDDGLPTKGMERMISSSRRIRRRVPAVRHSKWSSTNAGPSPSCVSRTSVCSTIPLPRFPSWSPKAVWSSSTPGHNPS